MDKLFEAVKSARFQSKDEFRPLPDIDDRDAWSSLDGELKKRFGELSEELLSSSPAPLPASLWADFYLNGTRRTFETNYFQRRKNLYALTVLECIENKGRFVDKIIDYVWAICEESCWVIPAHLHQNPLNIGMDVPLPSEKLCRNYIDLFCAETASILCWTKYLLGNRLLKYSAVVERISYELKRRILDNLDALPQMHWSGCVPGKHLNNWTPWIVSNLLAVALLEEGEADRRERWFTFLAGSLDAFLATYAPDGGCDEGPSYFNRAGASVLDALELFYISSNKQVDFWQNELIRNMACYILHAHIDGEYYINFADAGCRVHPDALLLRRCAAFMRDDSLKAHAEQLIADGLSIPAWNVGYDGIYRRLKNLFDYKSNITVKEAPLKPLFHYFPGIQLFYARQRERGGLYLAAKGGHNEESHNHNDVGNFIIYADGEAFIVDAGVETYSKKTFSEKRYDIWTMRSRYHNTAIIDGLDQKPGREYAARNVSASDEGMKAVFACDMAAAYGLGGSAKYARTLTLDREKGEITLTDEVVLPRKGSLILPLLTAVEPELSYGKAILRGKDTNLLIEFDAREFGTEYERIDLLDGNLKNNWQRDRLYRLLFSRRQALTRGKLILRFRTTKD